MVTFRRPKCLSDYLVRARFRSDAKEEVIGTSKCESNRYQICNFLCVGRTFHSKTNGKEFRINYKLRWPVPIYMRVGYFFDSCFSE